MAPRILSCSVTMKRRARQDWEQAAANIYCAGLTCTPKTNEARGAWQKNCPGAIRWGYISMWFYCVVSIVFAWCTGETLCCCTVGMSIQKNQIRLLFRNVFSTPHLTTHICTIMLHKALVAETRAESEMEKYIFPSWYLSIVYEKKNYFTHTL